MIRETLKVSVKVNKTKHVENMDPDDITATTSVLPIEDVLRLRVEETVHKGKDALDPRRLGRLAWKII